MVQKPKRLTSHDVAAAAGVSRSTVSRVLNGASLDLISPETRARVLRFTAELGYVPHAAARQLRLGRSRGIGLLLPSLTHHLASTHAFAEFLSGIAEVTDAAGYSIVLVSAGSPRLAFQAVRTGQVDGVLVMHPLEGDPLVRGVLQMGSSVVLMNQPPDGLTVSWADVDNFGGVRDAMRHLLERGHRRIGYISGRPGSIVARLRMSGYRDALIAHGLEPSDALIVTVSEPMLPPQGRAAMVELLSRPEPPTAVLCYRDQLAFGALRAVEESGRRVPRDVAVVGFDDEPMSAYERPPLTTIRADFRAKGHAAASILIDLVEGRATGPTRVMLPTELVIRESS